MAILAFAKGSGFEAHYKWAWKTMFVGCIVVGTMQMLLTTSSGIAELVNLTKRKCTGGSPTTYSEMGLEPGKGTEASGQTHVREERFIREYP